MRRAILAVAIGGILSGTAAAQGVPFKTSVAGAAGIGRTYDDEGQIGNGPQLGVSVLQRIAGRTFVEGAFDYLRHERTGNFEAKGRTLFFTGSVVQRFGRVHQPYVLGGVTLASHGGTAGFPPLNQFVSADSTDFGVSFGGGIAFAIGNRFEVGPEVRFFIILADEDSAPAYAYWLGGRFGIRF